MSVGSVLAEVVAVEARRLAERTETAQPAAAVTATSNVASLTQRRLMDPLAVIAGLPPDRRPTPSVAHYDELLAGRRAKQEAATLTEGATPS